MFHFSDLTRPAFLLITLGLLSTGCVRLHHAQLGDIDNRFSRGEKFNIMVSEIGINLEEAEKIAGIFAGKKDNQHIRQARQIISMFQMGPKTGNGVYNETYAENLYEVLNKECPSGKVTGLMAIRESNKYPVISGEIVRITGYCRK